MLSRKDPQECCPEVGDLCSGLSSAVLRWNHLLLYWCLWGSSVLTKSQECVRMGGMHNCDVTLARTLVVRFESTPVPLACT